MTDGGTAAGVQGVSAPSEDAVRRLLAPYFPDAPEGPRLVPVGEGGEHSAWWVGEHHVLRSAPDTAATGRQRREIALRSAVAARLPVAVPRSAAAGEWAPGLGWTLDVRLPGVSAERAPVGADGERDLAGLLAGLRAFPVAEASALGVPSAPARALPPLWRQVERAAGQVPVDPEALRRDAERTGAAGEREVPTVLLHADLKGEHLLTGRGRVTGVLDWTDAVLGDPAEDIAGLIQSVGAPAALRVAEQAGYGRALAARALHLVRCDTVVRLAERLRGEDDSPLPLLRAQRARAWEPTVFDGPSEG